MALYDQGEQGAKVALFKIASPQILTALTPAPHKGFPRFPQTSTGQQWDEIYEEPLFEDPLGKELATRYLTTWRDSPDATKRWLIVVGEYGTGKTALTKILQYRWLQAYKADPGLPVPFRIELRGFARQFDARGLLHHFLDRNRLGHLKIDFVEHLIRTGRVILILDGYDEMAQYLNARERRACLEALGELAADGAKGLVTSRPNYFTEGEELQVFEILYTSLKQGQYHLTRAGRDLIDREARVDQLLEQFLNRFERTLRDLEPEQTEALIARLLVHDPAGRDVVLGILRRVFRSAEKGAPLSLAGKPVIISYLLEVVEQLKEAQTAVPAASLTEWQVYKLIIDQLMVRDFAAAPEIAPEDRRRFLQRLALYLSKRDHHEAVAEEDFKDLVARDFRRELQRFSGDARSETLQRYFADLRRSSTLTRSSIPQQSGWIFSHNSLREYLVAEYLSAALERGEAESEQIPVSDAMRYFASSRSDSELQHLEERLRAIWPLGSWSGEVKGRLLTLLWDGILRLHSKEKAPRAAALKSIAGAKMLLNQVHLSAVPLSSDATPTDLRDGSFQEAVLDGVDLSAANLEGVNFQEAVLESVRFKGAGLKNANFRGACLIDADMSEAEVEGADFSDVRPGEIAILVEDVDRSPSRRRIEGDRAFGYLRFHGANTSNIEDSLIWCNHPRFPIVRKILERLCEQTLHQRRGLELRGAAQSDPPFARRFIRALITKKLLAVAKHRRDLLA